MFSVKESSSLFTVIGHDTNEHGLYTHSFIHQVTADIKVKENRNT